MRNAPNQDVALAKEPATSVKDVAKADPAAPALSMLVRVALSAPDLALQVDSLDMFHYRHWQSTATCRQRQLCDYVRIIAHFVHELEHGVQSPGNRYELNKAIVAWTKMIEETCPTPGWRWDA